MPRNNKPWISFNGRESTTLGAWVVSAPHFVVPAMRGKSGEIVGRGGDLFVTDGQPDTVEIKVTLRCQLSALAAIRAWLFGGGLLVFSWSPNRAYEARIERRADIKMVVPGENPIMQVEVTFLCQPFLRQYPEPAEFTISESGATFINPGTAPALPRFTIAGSGTFTVSIGGVTLGFTGIEDGIVVDSEAMEAVSLDGATLLNDHMNGTPWVVGPGSNTVEWDTSTGTVTGITILPRWRYL